MISVGNPKTLAFEICLSDQYSELGEVRLKVNGQPIGVRNPVYLPTFAAELLAFKDTHQATRTNYDFSPMTYEEVIGLFHRIIETDRESNGITPNDVWNYHRLHSVDDAVDDWEIYVFDTNGQKNIVCREIGNFADADTEVGEIIGTTMPHSEFIDILTACITILIGCR